MHQEATNDGVGGVRMGDAAAASSVDGDDAGDGDSGAYLVKAEVLFDGVRCIEDFSVAGDDEEETTECLQPPKTTALASVRLQRHQSICSLQSMHTLSITEPPCEHIVRGNVLVYNACEASFISMI